MKKIIEAGEIMPKYYGVAYPLYDRRAYVCYPFPINHVVGFFSRFWWRIRHAKIDERILELQKAKEDVERARVEHGLFFKELIATLKSEQNDSH